MEAKVTIVKMDHGIVEDMLNAQDERNAEIICEMFCDDVQPFSSTGTLRRGKLQVGITRGDLHIRGFDRVPFNLTIPRDAKCKFTLKGDDILLHTPGVHWEYTLYGVQHRGFVPLDPEFAGLVYQIVTLYTLLVRKDNGFAGFLESLAWRQVDYSLSPSIFRKQENK